MNNSQNNIDSKTVEGFGDEWTRFDQSGMTEEDTTKLFNRYFSNFPWDKLPEHSVGFDLGCGSGRWAKLVALRVGKLHCIDPSVAIDIAKSNLVGLNNCEFHQASVDEMPIGNETMDFGYSLGVLHHIPDTYAALNKCVSKLKAGAPFLIYLYYALDNRPLWFRIVWKISDWVRKLVSKMPYELRYILSQVIALFFYWPLARLAKFFESIGINVESFPLSSYRNFGFYVMRTDALDRFGTRLEQRFTKSEISKMMIDSGLENICFSDEMPFWCAVGYKKN